MQYSDAPEKLKSPPLADTYAVPEVLEVVLAEASAIDSVGIGHTDCTLNLTLIDADGNSDTVSITPSANGLYLIPEHKNITQINIGFTGSFIGRLALGKAVNIRTSIPKEPTFLSTNKPRTTLSGQEIPGLGGYNYRSVQLDSRYKIDMDKLGEIIKGYNSLSKGYPVFVSFEEEKNRLPFDKMYAVDKNQQKMSFESGINKALFSRKFQFEERF
jgi:hypothetical protein